MYIQVGPIKSKPPIKYLYFAGDDDDSYRPYLVLDVIWRMTIRICVPLIWFTPCMHGNDADKHLFIAVANKIRTCYASSLVHSLRHVSTRILPVILSAIHFSRSLYPELKAAITVIFGYLLSFNTRSTIRDPRE